MKKRIGKISIVTLIVCIALFMASVAILNPAEATPIGGGTPSIKLGSYTGPVGGTAVDDNVKAATDHLGTDTDAILADTISISGGTLPAAPTANSLAAFIASGGTGLGTELADSKSLVDAIGTNGTTVADTATGIAGIIGVDDADNAMATTSVVPNADGSVFERLEAVGAASATTFNHPNYFAVVADMTSATWNTVAAHEIAAVTGAVRIKILAETTTTVVTVGTNGTMALGYAGNTSAIFTATALDAALTNDVWTAVYGSAATTVVGGAEAQSSLTSSIFDVIVVGGVDVGYTIATNAGTTGDITFHIWWTPIDATGAVTAGAGGVL